MARDFCYLVGIIDVYSRRLLTWRLSSSMDTRFCLDALEEALEHYGRPETGHSVFGTGQTGLGGDVRTMQRSLYANHKTGEKDLIADFAEIMRKVIQIRALLWLIGGVVLLAQFLQVIGVIGK